MLWASLAPTPLLGIQPSCLAQPLPCEPQSHTGSSVASAGLGGPPWLSLDLVEISVSGVSSAQGRDRAVESPALLTPLPQEASPLGCFYQTTEPSRDPCPSSGHEDVLTCENWMKPQDSRVITAGGSVWWKAWVTEG